jgi:hypothetical protein
MVKFWHTCRNGLGRQEFQLAFARAAIFRAQLGEGIDFGSLETALQSQPPEQATPLREMHWVADNLGEIEEGLQSAGLPSGFCQVYGRLSGNIAANLSSYSCPEALGHTAIIFLDHFRGPQLDAIRYLQGDDSALGRISPAWQIGLLHPMLLEEGVPDGIQAGMGINTHIRSRDLTRSLYLSNPPAEYESDYTHTVRADISETIDELSGLMIPGHRIVRNANAGAMKRLIANGRAAAWDDHLRAQEMTDIQRQALWRGADEKAARFNRRYLVVGSGIFALARASEYLPFSGSEDDATDSQIAA